MAFRQMSQRKTTVTAHDSLRIVAAFSNYARHTFNSPRHQNKAGHPLESKNLQRLEELCKPFFLILKVQLFIAQ